MRWFYSPYLCWARRTSILMIVVLSFCALAAAQSSRPDKRSRMDIEDPDQVEVSAARRAAEDAVSFSPEIIISVLREERGLLLQVKRVLVEKAYQQGRILDPGDLSDDVLYQLIRDDATIRVIATREIADRGYIRVKPTLKEQRQQAELERRWRQQQGLATGKLPEAAADTTTEQQRASQSQEQRYYSRHEPVPYVPPADAIPLTPPREPQETPEKVQPELPQRRQQRAMVESDTPRMARIRPDELSDLLTGEPSGGGMNQAAARERMGAAGVGNMAMSPDAMSAALARGGSTTDGLPSPTEETRLDTRFRPNVPRREPSYDRPAIRLRPNPYADVPSLYDIYAQVARHSPVLDRFGADIFTNGTSNIDDLPMDLPAGPDYVLGPGDGLSIELWGGISERLQRVVNREGRVALPEVGTVLVAGKTLGDVQHQVQSVLRTQFRDVRADVSLARLRAVRVYVVGDVRNPGPYDVSSLSTPLNAVFAAGGPTERGSVRTIQHYRGKTLIQSIDVYDLILRGVRSDVQGLQPGDTVLVPPIGPEIKVQGMVRRPAIYELRGESNLAEALQMAGGVLSSGTLRHIEVERVQAHQDRVMLSLELPVTDDRDAMLRAMEQFKVQDGDKIRISPILPYAEKTVYLDGHVFHPGKYAYKDGMKLTDVVKSYKELLPEPSARHAEIIRLNPPDFTPTVLAFNLGDALSGKGNVPVLKPFDTVRIFGRYDFEDPPKITVSGEVRDAGDHLTNGVTRLSDAVYLAGGLTSDAQLDDAQVFRKDGNRLKVISVNLAQALSGDEIQNVLLQPKDRVVIHRNLAKLDPPRVMIQGEVAKPGKYPLGEDMTAADLVRVAGGLKRGAYTKSADLSRFVLQNGSKVLGEHEEVAIARALAGEADTDIRLRDGDVLTIRQLAGWNDVGATVTVKGEVVHAGTYGIKESERISSVLERAGGLRPGAYAYGAVLLRTTVRELEEKNHSELLRRVEGEKATLKLISDTDAQQIQAKQAALQQWEMTLQKLRDNPPQGRLVIHISSEIAAWKNTPNDMELRAGDILIIPKRPTYVTVMGQVFNPTALTYSPGKSARWYLSQAGGATNLANKKAIFVVRADGSVVGSSSSGFWGNQLSTTLRPGDTIVVPERAIGGPRNWQNILQTAQVVSSIAVTSILVANNF